MHCKSYIKNKKVKKGLHLSMCVGFGYTQYYSGFQVEPFDALQPNKNENYADR